MWAEIHRIGACDKCGVPRSILRSSESMRTRRIQVTAVPEDLQVRNLRSVKRTAVRAIENARITRRKLLEFIFRRVPATFDAFVRRPGDSPHSPRGRGTWIAHVEDRKSTRLNSSHSQISYA